MLVEIIKDIRTAEEKADEIKRRAQADARKIVQEAELKAVEIFQQSVAAAEAGSREIIVTAEKEGQSQVVPVQQRTAEEIQRIISAARSKQESAISLVMERIVKTDGDS